MKAALLAVEAGADGITAHLREDRRHIRDDDMARLKAEISRPLNFEMAATPDMLGIALATKPHAVCLVPERREELTTEGGLDVVAHQSAVAKAMKRLHKAGIAVPRPGSHTLRHTCVQRLVDARFSLKTIGDYVGHGSPESTAIYAKVSVESLREVALGDGEEVV